jgi:hypothetical protein
MDNPNVSVYEPVPTFICGPGGCFVTVDHQVRPEREIAGNFLEEMTDWLTSLEREKAPACVLFALRAVHDAACWWTDELDKPRPDQPTEPHRGA